MGVPVKVFYHLFQFGPPDDLAGQWRGIWHRAMMLLEYTGLGPTHGCELIAVGPQSQRDLLKLWTPNYAPWLHLVEEHDISENEGMWEKHTLRRLWRDCKTHHEAGGERFAVLYHHAKGSATLNTCVIEWSDYMSAFLVEDWRRCVRCIGDGFDMVGVQFSRFAGPHFSGNFWWAGSDYIARLPDPCSVGYYQDDSRISAEYWGASGDPKMLELWNSKHDDHYRARYPRSGYVHALLEPLP